MPRQRIKAIASILCLHPRQENFCFITAAMLPSSIRVFLKGDSSMNRLSPEILDYYDEEVVSRIAGKHGYSEREALALFLESKTYRLLSNPDMGMTQFGPEAIFNIWESERITGDPLRSDYMRMD